MEIHIRDQHLVAILKHIQTKKTLTGCSNLLFTDRTSQMPNQHSIHKRGISVRIPRALFRKIEKAALAHNMTLAAYVEWRLFQSTEKIELTPDDYRQIAADIEATSSGHDRRRDKRADADPQIRTHGKKGKKDT